MEQIWTDRNIQKVMWTLKKLPMKSNISNKKIKAQCQDDLPSSHMSFEHATEWANNAVIVAAAK